MRVFHLATDLGPTATGQRLSLLVPELANRGVEQTIGVIGERVPFGQSLPNVQPMPLRPFLDVAGWRQIRKAVANFRPTVVHCWGNRAAVAINVAGVSCRVLSTFDGDASLFAKRIGTRFNIPLIVKTALLPNRNETRMSLGFTELDRVIVAADRFEKPGAMRLAIWAMDLLKVNSPHWKLLLMGDGPARATVENFLARLSVDDNRTRFLGVVPNVAPILTAADCVWQPRTSGGVHFTLDALAAGLPVVTNRNPDLVSILDSSNSLQAGDAVAFIQITHDMFADPALHERLRTEARLTAARFPVEAAVERLLSAYSA